MLAVGAKGSAQQLVLSTILLQETPVGNIPYELHERLEADPRVALAVPLAMGDNIGGGRIIGTSPAFFTLSPSRNAPPTFQLRAGRLFEADFEAVLGSGAAEGLGLTIRNFGWSVTNIWIIRPFNRARNASTFLLMKLDLAPTSPLHWPSSSSTATLLVSILSRRPSLSQKQYTVGTEQIKFSYSS